MVKVDASMFTRSTNVTCRMYLYIHIYYACVCVAMPEEVDDWNDEYAQPNVVNYTFNTQSVLICWQLASTHSLFAMYVPTPPESERRGTAEFPL